MNICTTSVKEIEGIGEATAEVLADVGIEFLVDLLLFSPSFLASNTPYSIEQFEKWRSSALFLEIDGIDKQLAEVLVENRVLDPEHLSMLDLSDLQTMMEEGLTDDAGEGVPDMNTLASLQVAAARMHFGKQAQGIVRNEAGEAIENAEVRIAGSSCLTNRKGVWRISGLNCQNEVRAFVIAENYESLMVDRIVPESDHCSTDLLSFRLTFGISAPVQLNEFTGDDLGVFTDFAMQQLNFGEEDLREGDILRVTRHYVNGDIQFTSVFLSMENEILQMHTFRINPDGFDMTPPMYSFWRVAGGRLVLSQINDASVQIAKARHKERVRSEVPDQRISFTEAMGVPYTVSFER